jgi:aminoglycoside phosphotransferase
LQLHLELRCAYNASHGNPHPPPELATLVAGATWEQVTLGESGAQVYRLRNGAETCYLKVEPRRTQSDPRAEAKRLRWLQGRLPVPALRYADERQSYLLTAEAPGADASDKRLGERF